MSPARQGPERVEDRLRHESGHTAGKQQDAGRHLLALRLADAGQLSLQVSVYGDLLRRCSRRRRQRDALTPASVLPNGVSTGNLGTSVGRAAGRAVKRSVKRAGGRAVGRSIGGAVGGRLQADAPPRCASPDRRSGKHSNISRTPRPLL